MCRSNLNLIFGVLIDNITIFYIVNPFSNFFTNISIEFERKCTGGDILSRD